jgi:UDP-3-O-[3-hydroxymyristoyl] N-acetylglucosamine deacetylase
MLDIYQKTINSPISFEGIGLHSGKKSKITIFPGQNDQGIIFKRVDLKNNNLVPANYKCVSSAKLCTTLKNDYGVEVSTVEHLLAALYIAEIDNAVIEIDNKEVPIMDGSAIDFLNILKETEIRILTKKRKYLKILDKVELIDGKRKISIEPNNLSFEVDFQLNYENKIIGKQRNSINFQNDNLEDVSKSRTFCLFEDIEKIKKIGLAKGGSLENAVVVNQDKVLNDGGLRNKKEFVNHKILDLAGDFLLSGYRVLGKIECHQGGHELTNMFLNKLLNSKLAYTSIELEDVAISKKTSSYQSIKVAVNA